MNCRLAFFAGALITSGACYAQSGSTPVTNTVTSTPAPADTKLSIVERDETGAIRRPEVSPPEAAAGKLTLTPQQRKQVDIVLRERDKALDGFVRQNLKELVRLHTAAQSGLIGQTRVIVADLQAKSDVLRKLGRLPQDLAPALNDQQKRELQRMVSQYWQERIREETIAAEAKGERLSLQEFMTNEQLYFVGIELKRSYERVFGAAVLDIPSLLASVSLSAAQSERIHQVAGESLKPEAAGRLSPGEKARVFFDVYARLTPEQREVVLGRLHEGPTVANGQAMTPSVKPATADIPDGKK